MNNKTKIIKQKDKILSLINDEKSLFETCQILKDNGFKCRISETFGGMFIKFDEPIFNKYNIICSKNLADDLSQPLNNNLVFEVF